MKLAVRRFAARHWPPFATAFLTWAYFDTALLIAVGIALFGTGAWLALQFPTDCCAAGRYTASCDNPARGWLRGCHISEHGRVKRRALLATVSRRRYPTDAARQALGTPFDWASGRPPRASGPPQSTPRELFCAALLVVGGVILGIAAIFT